MILNCAGLSGIRSLHTEGDVIDSWRAMNELLEIKLLQA
jgi:hypothetical protein